MLEPVDTQNYGKDVIGGIGGANRKGRGSQHRAQDGKFESFGPTGRKTSYFGDTSLTKVEQAPTGRKAGGRKRAGGGDVGRAFYDQGLPGSAS